MKLIVFFVILLATVFRNCRSLSIFLGMTCSVFTLMFLFSREALRVFSSFCAWLSGRFVTRKMCSMPAWMYLFMCFSVMSPAIPFSLCVVIGVLGSVYVLHSMPIWWSGM